ncbi:TonB-dependent receptor [Sphingobium estronivorans]|uniref:TonB-dependent receptor n=1 Tax=Sphingobium estronivorans TaxID=1577690 RepID=UPI001968782A|nr:TonB-dependent receptor [Sphingobium estronivorans]
MVSIALAAPAYAQNADASPSSSAGYASNEIVVTARQRNETLIAAPVAVTAIAGDELFKKAVTDTRDLIKIAPSLSIDNGSNGGGAAVTLRGIGTSPSNAGFDQAVSIYVDGVQAGRARIIKFGMLDLAQVQVMKGPQALFFGKNSPAGVISMTSANPTRKFEGYARVGYEFVADEAIVEGAVSGPLSDSFGARLAVRYRNMDGWLRNTAGQVTLAQWPFAGGNPANLPQAPKTTRPGEEELAGRLTLSYEPVDSPFNAVLKIAADSYSDDGPSAGQQLYNCGAFSTPVNSYAAAPGVVVADPFGNCKFDRNYSNGALPAGRADNWPNARQNPYSKIKMYLGSLQLNYETDDLTLTSITGYYKSNARYFDNYDATVFMGYDASEQEKYRSISQELRLLSKFDSPVNFLIGAFYQNTKLDFFNTAYIAPLPADPATGKFHDWEKLGQTKGDTYSVFGQLIWNVTPHIELAGGVRYTHETKDSFLVHSYAHPLLVAAGVLAPVGKVFPNNFSDNNYSPEVTLTYRPTTNLTAYVAYKTGYKSGGYSVSTNLIPATITPASIAFESESIKGFEGGLKARVLDGRVTITSAIYSYKYSNLQVNSYNAATNSFSITNAAAARVKGAEVEMSARASEWLTLNGAVAYNHARYLDYIAGCWGGQTFALGCNVPNANGSFSQSLAGRPLARAPDWTANGGFDLTVPTGRDLQFGLSGNARYSSKYSAMDNGNPFGVQPSFWLFDASARVGTANGAWELALIGRNLGNKIYTGYVAEKPGGPITPGTTVQLMGLPNRGRQVMLQLTSKF